MDTVYENLRDHLDSLPGGYPATDNGVELRILKRLFTSDEAALAQQLTLKFETSQTIAERAGMDHEKVDHMLKDMARK